MAKDTISLTFNGYYGWTDLSAIPNEEGVFVVYDGAKNVATGELRLRRVLFIGSCERVRERILGHERLPEWLRSVSRDGDLYFTFAPFVGSERARAEAALIFEHQPLLNKDNKRRFNFHDTTMIVDGRTELLKAALALRGMSVFAY